MNWSTLGKILSSAVVFGAHMAESVTHATGTTGKINAAMNAANEILSVSGFDAVVLADKKVIAARAAFLEAYVALQNAVAEVKAKAK